MPSLPRIAFFAAWFSAALPAAQSDAPPTERIRDLPLVLWTNATWPNGFLFGPATGPAFVDFDRDGWPDLFAHESGQLWHNVDGRDWVLQADLDSILPPANGRYGSAWGDWDGDGLPDLATEPRAYGQDDCLHLLHNLGGGAFVDLAGDPNFLDRQPCGLLTESNYWADFDGDGDLDLFIPNYPPNEGSDGNHFLHNLGPIGPGGATRFSDMTATAGIDIPNNSARPEGTQVVDLDGDGDLELYSNGVVYQNRSTLDAPSFHWLGTGGTGIGLRSIVDEGTCFLDHDQDGDYDLLISYTFNRGMRLWENRGDGTFVQAPLDLIEDYQAGAGFALSVADWDGDGDQDFMALSTFRRNLFAETGAPGFEIAPHRLDSNLIANATSAWADWDRDGDLDLAVGNGRQGSYLFDNELYGPTTPAAAKRHLRVEVLRRDSSHGPALQTEFGASIRLVARNSTRRWQQQQIVESSSGYINQNEYVRTFHLPGDPVPGDPDADLRFDLSVDFPSLPELGYVRVDAAVNPVLANLDLALLPSREIQVFRDGTVVLEGHVFPAEDSATTTLQTSGGGLAQPGRSQGLGDPTPAVDDEWVGIELDTINARGPLHLREVILDGAPADPVQVQGRLANLLLWDVTRAGDPFLVAGGHAVLQQRIGNHRGHHRVDMTLRAGRIYRLVAKVSAWRTTAVSAPISSGFFDLSGGLRFIDPAPASGAAVSTAGLDTQAVPMAARLSEGPGTDWQGLGLGATAQPLILSMQGIAAVGQSITAQVDGAPAFADIRLLVGTRLALESRPGFLLGPLDELQLPPLTADAKGHLATSLRIPESAAGLPLFVQAVARTNGIVRSSEILATRVRTP